MRRIKYKIILILFAIGFNVAAESHNSLNLEDIEALSNQTEISFEEGVQALLELSNIFSSRDLSTVGKEQLREWRTLYNQIHNRLFILTHIARINHQLSGTPGEPLFRMDRQIWEVRAENIKLRIKRNQLELFRQILQIISSEDFDHSKHQFNKLSDLAKVNWEGVTVGNTINVNVSSSSFSKRLGKRGYILLRSISRSEPPFMEYAREEVGEVDESLLEDEAFMTRLDLEITELVSEESSRRLALKIVEELTPEKPPDIRIVIQTATRIIIREYMSNYSQQFVSEYEAAESFDMSYAHTTLPVKALQFFRSSGDQ